MDTAARLAVGALLLGAAAAKLRAHVDFPELLAAHGIPQRLRRPLAAAVFAVEAALGVLLLAGVATRPATIAAVVLGAVFTLVLVRARARGLRRLSCGCFGATERSTAFLIARAAAFTALAAVAAFGGALDLAVSRETLVLGALAILALGVVVLGALVLALYRQVGVLSLRITPRAPLELAEEGPEVGREAPALAGLQRRGSELVAFFSEDCRLCRELAPAVRALEREGLSVRVAYEGAEAETFDRWNVPGAPFFVHVVDGEVAAKGLVNTLEQLDDLLALGAARRGHVAA